MQHFTIKWTRLRDDSENIKVCMISSPEGGYLVSAKLWKMTSKPNISNPFDFGLIYSSYIEIMAVPLWYLATLFKKMYDLGSRAAVSLIQKTCRYVHIYVCDRLPHRGCYFLGEDHIKLMIHPGFKLAFSLLSGDHSEQNNHIRRIKALEETRQAEGRENISSLYKLYVFLWTSVSVSSTQPAHLFFTMVFYTC